MICGHSVEQNIFHIKIIIKNGYSKLRFFDLNKFIWNKKFNNFNNKINFISPSNWMHNCAKSSKIFKKMKGTKIPYTIDFDNWKFNKQDIAKKQNWFKL